MYKVLVVDDEPLMRQGLSSLIDWAALGCEVAAEAENGDDALACMKQAPADVVICDIKMPGMNGLTLGQSLLDAGYRCKLIYLTAYSEFEYAQSAMRLNAVDYVVKSSYIERIPVAVRRATALLDKERADDESRSHLRRALDSKRQAERERAVFEAISQPEEDADESKLKAVGVDAEACDVLALRLAAEGDETASLTRARQSMREMLARLLPNSLSVVMENGVVATLCDGAIPNLPELMDKLREMMRVSFHVDVVIGVSDRDAGGLGRAYQNAKRAMACAEFWGSASVVRYDEQGMDAPPSDGLRDRISALLSMAQAESPSRLLDEFDAIVRECELSRVSVSQIKTLGVNLCSLYHSWHGFGAFMFSDCDRLYQAATAREYRELLEKYLLAPPGHARPKYSALVEQTVQLIQTRYMEYLSVNQLAGELHVSSGYLGNLFRKETGETITDALLGRRLERTLVLLRDPSNKINKIAEMVGFSDPAYFTNVFTKHMGMSPRAYRNTMI